MSGEIELVEESGFGNASGYDDMVLNCQNVGAGSGSVVAAPGSVVVAPGSSEMKFDDVETGAMVACRICLECDGEEDDDLISPCLCKGTQQFVHRSCLDHWRSVKEGFAFSHCTTCKAQFHLRVVKLNAHSWPKIKFRLFVARDVFLVFLAMQMVIGLIGGVAYIVDKNGSFKISLRGNWDLMLSTHPIPLFYCIGVFFFFVLVGFFGMVLHCLSCNNDPRVAGCQNFCFGWGMLDCFPASMEVIVILVIISVIIFAVLGLAYGFLAATMGMQRIWQRHYHILTKKELTQEYVVEDLHGCYTPPELAPEDVDRLIMFKLM
ncbi:E3 ubiquitin-protein ligase MARCHF8 [Helianthus annuus]|uniref:E3 ubiquitin-protein ligase MARCHF8 n=1 Tax=Helianthus annuus TaxID=4232 RepID=UPI000B8FF2CB|nr:E3 ubiquitin-protein ligase MARCHF8 [Helianthus annuus]